MARPKPKPKAEAPAAEETSATETGPSASEQAKTKREAQERLDAELTEKLIARYGEHQSVSEEPKTESLATVAKELSITTTKAGWLLFFHAVETGLVPAITGRTEAELVKNLHKARTEAGTHSAWGWLAARSGKSESWVKTKLGEAGLYEAKAENIASVRSEKNPKPAAAKTDEAKPDGDKPKPAPRRRRGNAS